jgi:hypothetical protein
MNKTQEQIVLTMNKVTDLLLEKNQNYGDSATKPLNIFANGTPEENICARIDDKLARIKNAGICKETYDTIDDLIGYLCLLKITIDNKPITRTGALSPTGARNV